MEKMGVTQPPVGNSASGPDEGDNRSDQFSRAHVPHMLWSINVQGTANLFRAFALVEEERPTVVVFQKPDFCPRQQGQVRARLNSTGYASWTAEACNAGAVSGAEGPGCN